MTKLQKMNLQLLSDPGTDPDPQPQPTVDYAKIENIIAKRTEQTEKSILKNYFKENGIEEGEIENAIANFKELKESQKNQFAKELDELRKENESFKTKIFETKLNDEFSKVAKELGVETNSLEYVKKLADLSAVKNESGDVDAEKIKTQVAKILEDLPILKNQTGGIQPKKLGLDPKTGGKKDDLVSDELDKIFGIKK